MPRVIVFDLIGTVLDIRTMDPLFERFFGDGSVRKEWFMQTLHMAMSATLTNAYEDFGVHADTGLEITARQYKVSLLGEEKNLILGAMRKLRPYPDVPRSFQRLRDAGLRLAALTNSTAQTAETQLVYSGLREHFEQVISADEIRCIKPAADVYHLAARRLNVEQGQIRLVTAHDWDAIGALRAGCTAAFVARPGHVLNPFGPQPDIYGSDLDELTEKILKVELGQD
jgi:2-haloacid dehalogenase